MARCLETRPSCARVTVPNLVVLVQTVRAHLPSSAGKVWTSHSTFQGHLRLSELTRISRLPMTLFVVRSNYGPVLCRFFRGKW